MLRFDQANNRFNFRSVAVIINDDKVLLHKSLQDGFWALPGGRVEFFEFSEDTISREIFEEIGLDSKVIRALWLVESFFEYDVYKYHELATYYLTDLYGAIDTDKDIESLEKDLDLIFRWFPLKSLVKIELYPVFLKIELLNLPKVLKQIQINEINTNY